MWVLEIGTQVAILADFYTTNNRVQEKALKCDSIITVIGLAVSSALHNEILICNNKIEIQCTLFQISKMVTGIIFTHKA